MIISLKENADNYKLIEEFIISYELLGILNN